MSKVKFYFFQLDYVEKWGFRVHVQKWDFRVQVSESGALEFECRKVGLYSSMYIQKWGFTVWKVQGLLFPGPDLNSVYS